jgi:hypothetical protein
VRVIDVDTGKVLDFADLEEMGRVPATTIGGKQSELARLELTLASSDFARDLVQGAHIAAPFPFGAVGRLAAGGNAIAFDAGDWLYVADADGRIRSRLVDEAAYDPRFTPDGKWLFFRRAMGHVGHMFARYELYVAPADLSAPPHAVAGTAGMHDHFVVHPDGKTAFALASQPGTETCFVSLALKPPFATKRLGCVDGDERVVESAISPKGKFAALTTKEKDGGWHLRVLSLATGKVVSDEPESAGLALRAISDRGLLVESGLRGALVVDAATGAVRALDRPIDFGFRGFFRSDTELVYATPDGSVATLDVTKE